MQKSKKTSSTDNIESIDTLKIEVFDLREKLQWLYNEIKIVQKEIQDRVDKIRNDSSGA